MTGLNFTRTLCALALGLTLFASRAAATEFDQSHALFTGVLTNYVKAARVNYAALKAHPQDLNRYLTQVAAVNKSDFKQWSEPQQIAFLSNAYNAYTLKLIIDHYPLQSIKDIGNFINGPWDQPVVKLFGETMDLNTVEHKILRVTYAEPRLHFVLVCAAKGCPPLRGEAYVGTWLEEQLVDQATTFLAETSKNRIAVSERVVYLSPIFKWYGSDFEKNSGSVLTALKPYWPGKSGTLTHDDFKVRYTDYDWSLNEQSK